MISRFSSRISRVVGQALRSKLSHSALRISHLPKLSTTSSRLFQRYESRSLFTKAISANFEPSRSKTIVYGAILGSALFLWLQDPMETKGSASVNGKDVCTMVRVGDVDALSRMLGDHSFNSNVRHPYGWSPIHVAAANNNMKILRWLLDHGADVNAVDEYQGPTAQEGRQSSVNFETLFDMIRARQQEFCPYIDPRAPTSGFTALHFATINGNTEMVKLLLSKGADPTLKDAEGRIPRDYLDVDTVVDGVELDNLLIDAEKRAAEEQRRKEKELRRKYPLEQQLKEKIVGQEGPIHAIAAAIRRKDNGWADSEKPLVFLFLGSSGIGKTELAKQVASYIHKGGNNKFIRIDLAEYQSKHEVSKFIGAPPGYVGYEDNGGQLAEKLKAAPNAVVLLDEVDKAHPDVLTVLLALYDEGRITNGKNETVDAKDAIFIMTSNLAQQEIAEAGDVLREDMKKSLERVANPGNVKKSDDVIEEKTITRKFMDSVVYPILRSHFKRDEFIGRINETLLFVPFDHADLLKLATMELENWKKRAQDRHKIHLDWDKSVVELVTQDYNVSYGARSIKHGVEKRIVNQLANAHERDEIGEGSTVHLYVNDGDVCMRVSNPPKTNSGGGFFGWGSK